MGGTSQANRGHSTEAHDNSQNSASGSAYIFYHNGTRWVEEARFTANDGFPGSAFGHFVSYNGGNGADSGSARIYPLESPNAKDTKMNLVYALQLWANMS